jgi:hypothetical protein
MATIINERIISFKSNIEFKTSDTSLLVNAGVSLNPILSPDNKNVLFFIVTYDVKTFSAPVGVSFETEIVLPFTIIDISDISVTTLYECVKITNNKMQLILDSIISGKDRLIVPPIGYEELEDELKEYVRMVMQR